MIITEKRFRNLLVQETKRFLKEQDQVAPQSTQPTQVPAGFDANAQQKEAAKNYVGQRIGEIIKYLNGGAADGKGGVLQLQNLSTALLNGWKNVRANEQKAPTASTLTATLGSADQYSAVMNSILLMAGQRPAQSNFPYDSLGLGPVNMNINKPKLDAAIGDYASFIKNMKSILSVQKMTTPATPAAPAAIR